MDKNFIKNKLENQDFSTTEYFQILIYALNNKDNEIVEWCSIYKIPIPSQFKNHLFNAKINFNS